MRPNDTVAVLQISRRRCPAATEMIEDETMLKPMAVVLSTFNNSVCDDLTMTFHDHLPEKFSIKVDSKIKVST